MCLKYGFIFNIRDGDTTIWFHFLEAKLGNKSNYVLKSIYHARFVLRVCLVRGKWRRGEGGEENL